MSQAIKNDELLNDERVKINVTLPEWLTYKDTLDRHLVLSGQIYDSGSDDNFEYETITQTIVRQILNYNYEDNGKDKSERKPIWLYIDSPGGDSVEGFALVSAIEASKTPVYTVNIGQWSSMGFLIGIAGKKRFALRYSTFLMHDGNFMIYGTSSKAQDQAKFNERFEQEIVKPHILKHTSIDEKLYDQRVKDEWYMLATDAKQYGVIDVIVETIDDII